MTQTLATERGSREREREAKPEKRGARERGRVSATEPSGLLTHSHAATTNCTQTSAGGCGWLAVSFRVSAFPFLSGESETSHLASLSLSLSLSIYLSLSFYLSLALAHCLPGNVVYTHIHTRARALTHPCTVLHSSFSPSSLLSLSFLLVLLLLSVCVSKFYFFFFFSFFGGAVPHEEGGWVGEGDSLGFLIEFSFVL